ncbi:MAG: glycerophosphodiester phosphodiesterase family protein [Micropepsaceae bacterium]
MWFLKSALKLLLAIALTIGALAIWNGAFWSGFRGKTLILAHRGLAQTYHRRGLTNETCTAARIDPPEHPYLENTIASMRAAFAAGADIVEFDIHPTTDGQFAVLHDWTLDCRTNGHGVTREHSMAELKTLDIGYGYTADGGRTFPFRGKGVGLMPTMDEVLSMFPNHRFLINIKSNDPAEADLLATRLRQLPPGQQALLMSYGGARPIARLLELMPGMKVMSKDTLVECLTRYIGLGWFGIVPKACENSLLLIPRNATFLFWGWPNLMLERMQQHGAFVFVTGDYAAGDVGASGIDTLEAAQQWPADFPGGIWTNRVDRVAPYFRRTQHPPPE